MMQSFEFEAIGTHWQIDIETDQSSTPIAELVQSRIQVFDRNYSRFRSDSLIANIAQRAGVYQLPEDAKHLMELYQNAYRLTQGMFTPLIGQTLVEAGYDATYSLQPKTLTTVPDWDTVLAYDATKNQLTVKRPVMLDFGAAGKGYIVDIIGELLEQHNITSYTIDAGGDIRHRGASIRVGLENPQDHKQVIGVVRLENQSLCGSAGNRRTWANFHHILNPKTLNSAKNLLAVWTTAQTTAVADAMSTCLFFTEPEILQQRFAFEYAILKPDFTLQISKNFPYDEIFTRTNAGN